MDVCRPGAATRHPVQLRWAFFALLLFSGPMFATAGQRPLPTDPARKQAVPQPAEPISQDEDAVPQPIPRMTAYDLPTQPPVVTYTAGHLTIDSENTTLSEALEAISGKTRMLVDPVPASSERFSAHFSGTPWQVLSDLLNGSGFGYVLVASRADRAEIQKVILTKIPTAIVPAGKVVAAAPVRTTPDRVAMYVPPEAAAERRGESILDMGNKPSATDEPSQLETILPAVPLRADAAADSPNGDGSTASNSRPQGKAEDPKQVSPAGQYMQELYKMRLQQQQQLQGTPPPPPPQ